MLRLKFLTEPFRQRRGDLPLLVLNWLPAYTFGLNGRADSPYPDFARARHFAVVAPLAILRLSAPVIRGDEQGGLIRILRGSL